MRSPQSDPWMKHARTFQPPLPDEVYVAEFGPAPAPVSPLKPTPFVRRDPLIIPPRPWVYGRHMIRKQVSVTVAPGSVGKSSLTLVGTLCVVSRPVSK